MRKDFGKVVIERPRRGSRTARSAKARNYGTIWQDEEGYEYEGLTRLPVSRKQEGYNNKLGSKSFSDLLGPLTKYMESSCGRLWDDVYSEIARTLGRSGSEGIRHIKDTHIDVEVNTYRGVDNEVWAQSDHGVYKISDSYRIPQFYVEPETGILRKAPLRKNFVWRERIDPNVIHLTADSDYRRIAGVWYYMEYGEESSPLKAYTDKIAEPATKYRPTVFELVDFGTDALGRRVARVSNRSFNAVYRVILKKRQLSKKELLVLRGRK